MKGIFLNMKKNISDLQICSTLANRLIISLAKRLVFYTLFEQKNEWMNEELIAQYTLLSPL